MTGASSCSTRCGSKTARLIPLPAERCRAGWNEHALAEQRFPNDADGLLEKRPERRKISDRMAGRAARTQIAIQPCMPRSRTRSSRSRPLVYWEGAIDVTEPVRAKRSKAAVIWS